MKRTAALPLLFGLATPVAAQPALELCLGTATSPQAQIDRCTEALTADGLAATLQARALRNRAIARMDREAPDDVDAAIADLDRALVLDRRLDYAHDRAMARFYRGDFSAAARDALLGADMNAAIAAMGTVIDANPAEPDAWFVRAALRILLRDQLGADADLAEGERLWRARP